MVKSMNFDIKKIGIILLVFIYLYVPPFFAISMGILGSLFFILYILLNLKYIEENLSIKSILMATFGIISLLLYAVSAYLREYQSFENVISAYAGNIYLITYTLCGAVVVCDIFAKNDYSVKEIWATIIYVGVIQGILGLAAYLFDPIQSILCEFLKNVMDADAIAWWRDYRLYGLSCSMTFSMPIMQSIIGGMALIYAKQYNKKYLFCVPILWGSALINARITLVIVFIELCVIFVYCLRYRYGLKIKRNVLLLITIGVIAVVLGGCFIISNREYFSRITDPIVEVLGLLGGEVIFKTNGYLAYFFVNENAFVIPQNENILWGGGIWNNVSDIGYLYDLWIGGIVYSCMIYMFYLLLFMRWYKKLNKHSTLESLITIMSGIVLFVVNVKGHIFSGMSEFINLCYLLIGVSIFIKESDNRRIRMVNRSE